MLRLILVLDDNEHVLEAVSRVLKAAGYPCVIAQSAHEAIKLLDVFTPSVVMVDYYMPNMTGIQFLKHLRAEDLRLRTVPVIGVGTNAETCAEFMENGANAAIRKPFNATELLTTIAQLVPR